MRKRPTNGSEAGFTLIELLVYCVLIVLVVTAVGGIMNSVQSTSKSVRTVTNDATEGQLVADSITAGVRNSSDFRLTSPSGTDQLLVARVAESGTTVTWACAAWYYSASGTGSIRFTRSTAAIVAPNASGLLAWTLLDDGITPASGTSVFSASGALLNVAFKGTTIGRPSVLIQSSAFSRAGASGSLTCF